MEGIHAALCVRAVLPDTSGNPRRTVATYTPDAVPLIRGQHLEEAGKSLLIMSRRRPNDGIRVIIHDNSEVFMTFFIACLVDADIYQAVIQDV